MGRVERGGGTLNAKALPVWDCVPPSPSPLAGLCTSGGPIRMEAFPEKPGRVHWPSPEANGCLANRCGFCVCEVKPRALFSLMLWKTVPCIVRGDVPIKDFPQRSHEPQTFTDQQLSNSYHLSRLSPEMGPACCVSAGPGHGHRC